MTSAVSPLPLPLQPAVAQASSSTPSNVLNGNDFMTLLVAQLKAQDPTSPMDPTQFVGQLVQFNSLQQLININHDLTPPAATTPPTAVLP
jgi:flagellar basal-body rod modification protein FlgD